MNKNNNEILKNIDKNKQNQIPTYIYALGGIEEVGKNMYVVEHDDEIIIVDCGIKFADEHVLLGVNSIICPFDYLVKNQHRVAALVLTHAHEDHIGAIPYLLKSISVPVIYGAKLSIGLVKRKLSEHKDLKKYKFECYEDNSVLNTKHFKIEFFRQCHSIPDAFGVLFETINGRIIESGDFRFDFSTPGEQGDVQRMVHYAKRGIDVLLCESTNAEIPGFSVSESKVLNNLRKIIVNAKGRVFLSTFASNLGRIAHIIEMAIKAGRKIAVAGKAIDNNIRIANEVGFLNVKWDNFIELREVGNYQDQEVMILSTGSQGEEMAALNLMANNKHPWINFKPSDTLIMSSNPIPGNFSSVDRLLNTVSRHGIDLYVNSPELKLHSSGHATETEQQLLFKLLTPKYLVPIHGEYKMLRALRRNAVLAGIQRENVIQVVNGQKLKLLNHELSATDEFIDIYDVFVDGNNVNKDSTILLKDRKQLANDGIFTCTILIDQQKKSIEEMPILTTKGCIHVVSHLALFSKMTHAIKDLVSDLLKNNKNVEEIKKQVHQLINTYIWRNKRKKPIIKIITFFK